MVRVPLTLYNHFVSVTKKFLSIIILPNIGSSNESEYRGKLGTLPRGRLRQQQRSFPALTAEAPIMDIAENDVSGLHLV